MSDFPFPHSERNCAAQAQGICGRLHVGDLVKVVYGGKTQLGFMQTGEIVAQPTASGYTVHFADGVPWTDEFGTILDMITDDLTYSEGELELVSN